MGKNSRKNQQFKASLPKENMTEEEILKQKIREYIPKEKILFYTDENNGLLTIKFLKTKATIAILKDNTWDEITKHIDTKVKKRKDIKCVNCNNESLKNMTCPKCTADVCAYCYVSIYKLKKGIFECPTCKYSHGEELPDFIVEAGAKILEKKLGIDN
jgi:hypothetical protein